MLILPFLYIRYLHSLRSVDMTELKRLRSVDMTESDRSGERAERSSRTAIRESGVAENFLLEFRLDQKTLSLFD